MKTRELLDDEPLLVGIMRNFLKKGGLIHFYFGGWRWITSPDSIKRTGTSTHLFYKDDGAFTIPDSILKNAKAKVVSDSLHDSVLEVRAVLPRRPRKKT